MNKGKIATIIGARPQFVKMALVSKALERRSIKEVIVHTGQHYDHNMSDIFFEELDISMPDYDLGVGSGSPAAQAARMLVGIERVLKDERPDIVLVYGDTNSTLAGALAAAKLNIRIAHVEAGLRSRDFRMPEEVNRVVADGVSSIFFCPTEIAVNNLRREGKKHGVYLVGDVMYDLIKKTKRPDIRRVEGEYVLCTVHRAENTDSPARLKNIFMALKILGRRVILPLHPRTAVCIKKYRISPAGNIKITKPVGYREMISLEDNAAIIITDSGGVQKEAMILGVPCVTLRERTEWAETVKAGANILAGADTKKIVSAVKRFSRRHKEINAGKLYGAGRAHEKIVDILEKELKG